VAVDGDEEAHAALVRTGGLDLLVIPFRLTEAGAGSGPELAAAGAERAVAVVADDPLGGDGPAAAGRLLDGLVHPDTERTPAQAMLAGVLSFPGITGVLSPAATPGEIAEHAGATALPLSDAETRMVAARLDEARESQHEP
jgi:aryl-alcohol dehydrogenase-like predicted oxidoreductase